MSKNPPPARQRRRDLSFRTLRRWWIATSLSIFCIAAWAHDSWLRVAPAQPGSGLLALELGVGARYPRSEGPTPSQRLAQAGCLTAGAEVPLMPRGEQDPWLVLRARTGNDEAAACWVELRPQDITLTPALVQTYFDDIRAPPAVRTAWAERQRAGVAWHEVYRKFIRIEVLADHAARAMDLAALRRPRGFALELVPVGGEVLRAGAPSEFLALADGRPVAGLAVEFVSRRSPVGLWRETGADGRIRLALPYGGEWLLRSTVLDVPATATGAWQSRFATLTLTLQ